jgi:glycosyltransferase involved in cell wall biosynthesis
VTNPEWFRLLPRWNFRKALVVSVRHKKVLYLCNSKTTRKNLLNAFPDKSLKTLVYQCQISAINEKNCSQCSACVTREVLPNKFLLMVGTIEPRKDYAFILNVIKRLGDRSLPIIVVGRVGWKSKEIIKDLEHSNKVIWYKDACDGSLIHLYQAAVAFISTSLDEGFNLPAAEAHHFGTPLLLRNIEIHQEFHSDHAKFFSNESELANLINAPTTYPRKNNPLRSERQDQFPKKELLNILNDMRVD